MLSSSVIAYPSAKCERFFSQKASSICDNAFTFVIGGERAYQCAFVCHERPAQVSNAERQRLKQCLPIPDQISS